MDSVKEAAAIGAIGDLRVIDRLLDALDDPSAELADRVANAVLPAFGRAILPNLRHGLQWDGKSADARRLAAIAAIDPDEGRALCRRAIAEGSTTVKARALEVLAATDPEEGAAIALDVLSVLAPAGAGKKAAGRSKLDKKVRDAAMGCLGKSTRDEALEILIAALLEYDGTEVYGHPASHAYLPTMPHPKATDRLLREMQRIAAESLALRQGAKKGKKAAAAKELKTVEGLAGCVLSIVGERGDRKAVPALVGLLTHPSADIRRGAVEALTELGDPAGLEAAAALIDDPEASDAAVKAAWRLPPGPRFERLAPLCADLSAPRKKMDAGRGGTVLDLFEEEADDDARRSDWDPRWADALRPHLDGPEAVRVAVALEVVLGAGATADLLRAVARPSKDSASFGALINVVQALGRHRVREAVGPLVALYGDSYHSRHFIGEALKAIGDPAAIPLLKERTRKMRQQYVKAMIEKLIDELSVLTST
jgi:HEAT repeat protein